MPGVSDLGGSCGSKTHPAPISLSLEFPGCTQTRMDACVCVCVSVFPFFFVHLGAMAVSILPSCLQEEEVGAPSKCREGSYLQGSCPRKHFAKKQEREGGRTPTNQFYKLDAATASPCEGWLGREEERRSVKSLDKVIKGRSHLPAPGPRLPPSPPESSSLQHNPAQRGKGREGREEVNKMAFLPQ